ncbi:glycoside hydrolase family 9 protein [Pedobacter sp. UYP1]|uniref:glycoside hydrolase family 9 protein n=1 Tax=Pedobacter sp. UYP1 TaxID=1756396 RepID=UPI0033991D98
MIKRFSNALIPQKLTLLLLFLLLIATHDCVSAAFIRKLNVQELVNKSNGFNVNFTTISAINAEEPQHPNDSLNQEIVILANQVAYNLDGPKTAMIKHRRALPGILKFELLDAATQKPVFSGKLGKAEQVADWDLENWYSPVDFTAFHQPGVYKIQLIVQDKKYQSYNFKIGVQAIGKIGIPAMVNFFNHQRANSKEELAADKQIRLFGSDQTVNLQGGWCDASGDISKYFSHLAYTNYMLPQQIPMVDWSMINTVEQVPDLLGEMNIKAKLEEEALYGADYIMRSLSPEGYFYMTVFSYFDKDPNARRVVGLLADSKTTSDYQCAYREGGGVAIAALARISKWNKDGAFSSAQYLAAAERAFSHLQKFSTLYADDGKDNIIDDYCALMAATELWMATGKTVYGDQARKRSVNLKNRLAPEGYFIANDANRPFWHAADAGLPVIALARYLDIEKEQLHRKMALQTIKTALDYNLKVTHQVINPFGYARQHFLYRGKVKDGFFIPHENESGWWWQGEDARLGSLAAAAIVGGRLVYPDKGPLGVKPELAIYASKLVSWILGSNPYNMCMLYGYGHNNVPYMSSMYGHGSGKGGISNGITGKDGKEDGSGIDFKVEDHGNEWRWSEQWIPHTSWFLQAVTAMSANPDY